MSREPLKSNRSDRQLKSRDKVTRKMTRDGLVERNEATGEEAKVSKREADFNLRGEDNYHRGNTPAKKPKRKQTVRHDKADSQSPQTEQASDGLPIDIVSEDAPVTDAPQAAPLSDDGRVPDAPLLKKKRQQQRRQVVKAHTAEGDAPISDLVADTDALAPDTPEKPVPDTTLNPDKASKLQFSPGKDATDTPKLQHSRKVDKAQVKADRAVTKLETAKEKLPAKKKLRTQRVFDESKGKAKRKLYFENEVKSQSEHIKGAKPLRPVKAAGNSALAFGHRKMYQVQHENVGTEAAHKGEIAVESVTRTALRHHKTAPYRKVEKLERKVRKQSIKLSYQKALAENPKLSTNPVSRSLQKRKIKKEYAKAAREAQKSATFTKRAAESTARAAKAVAGVVRRHPIATSAIVLLSLMIFMMLSLVGAFGGMGSGGLGGILAASYLAEDADINNAELVYTEWETDLQLQIAAIEATYPGYDEYKYNVGEISHNPYELMSYLTVLYQNFTYNGVEAQLRALFAEQYTLTFTPSTETRYADPTDADGDGDYEPYEWKTLTVTLTARSFTNVASTHMSSDQTAHYALLLSTKGSRQYFGNPFGDVNWLTRVTSYYGYRVHPISGVKNLHRGVDIGFPRGTEILAVQDGTVTFSGYSGDYGNVVIIENADGLMSKYAHCDILLVSAGQTVSMGDVIATVGSTGNSTGPHLHLEVLKNGEYLNPLYFADTGSFGEGPVYGYPGAPMGDGSYAAMMEEAEKYIGYPYVWGGSSPSTSFDCSGFVCWVINQSGVGSVGRTTAQGLYNLCTPVSPADAQPGDLIFFHSTYSTTDTVTHVGIYVGNNMMIHAGNPIGYVNYVTRYGSHFYAFGRI